MDASPTPWNKGRAQGQKRTLTPAQVGVVKEVLATSKRLRDLALFSLALDTLLRASDLLALRVSDVQDAGGAIRSTLAIKQQKTVQRHATLTPDRRPILTPLSREEVSC